jgi:hypothetical protein
MAVSEMVLDLANERAGFAENSILDLRRQILVGKIDRSLEMGEYARQAIPPTPIKLPEFAAQLAERLAALRLGLGRNEIGDGFGLQQIELAVQKRPAGELARFGKAQTEAVERLHDSSEHNAAAVYVKLGDILSGRAVRPREP